MNKNILITGGAGFIGSHICQYLLNHGIKSIRVLDNLSTGNKNNIKPLLDKFDNLEFMWGDISNIETCRKACKDIDIICHQAALGSVPRSVSDPLSSHNSNINGTFNLLLAAKENRIKRFVYASSSSVYGDSKELPKVEDKIGNVLSPYALNKKVSELYADIFTKCYDMECIGLRYFNVFGPRQDPNGAYAAVIPKFIKLIRDGKAPTINGDGSFSRDFTYIDNVVSANILAMTTENKECFGEVFNIGAGGRITILELFNIIKNSMKSDIQPIFGNKRVGDIPHSNADISKAMDMFGYRVNVNFREGIEQLLKYNNKQFNSFNLLNPGAILSKDKSEYILDYILNNNSNICVYIDKDESDLCNKYLIPGNKELLNLKYEENKFNNENESKFGIIGYNKSFKYGKIYKIPNHPRDIINPIRIIIDENIHNQLQNVFKKLVILNTEYDSPEFYNDDINKLIELTDTNNYISKYNNFRGRDVIDRNYGLYGKYYDSLFIFQKYQLKKCLDPLEIKLYNWYNEFKNINNLLIQDIVNNLNRLFTKSKYIVQNNYPIRISTKNSKGTPLHQDSQSIIINKNKICNFKNPSFNFKEINDNEVLIETNQDKNIFNLNYTIYEEFPSQSMRICEHSIHNMQYKSYFYRVKQNVPNEAFLFNPSHVLHFRPNQYKGLSIRGDFRIIELTDYKKSNLPLAKGPRMNNNVCFANVNDCKSSKSQYSVFSDKIYE